MREGGGLLGFSNTLKRAMVVLGAVLWALTMVVSVRQGYRILQGGMQEMVTIEAIVATVGFFVAGGVIFEVIAREWIWREVLHNFPRYFVLLVLVPAVLWAAWFVPEAANSQIFKYGVGAVALVLVLVAYLIGSPPPPPVERIETMLDVAFKLDTEQHVADVLQVMSPEHAVTDALFLRRFPEPTELGGRLARARQALDRRPRINPQGFVALVCGKSVLACEGAVDLTTGEIIHHRLRQFEYGDITMLAIEGTGAPVAEGQAPVRRPPMLPIARRRHVPTYKEAFVVGLRGNERIVAVVRDGRALSDARTFQGIQEGDVDPLSKPEDLQKAWNLLTAGKRAALAKGVA
jgi:hypothetical protein